MNSKTELEELRQRISELEQALREKETEAEVLLRTAPLGIHECDTEGRITFVNPSQERITGYTADELLGTYVWDRIAPGPDKDSLPAYLKRLVSEQPLPTPFISKNIRKNGETFDVRIDWNYKRDPQGKVTGFVSIVSDITEQKRAEEALFANKAILEATIESLPSDFWAIGLDGRYMMQNSASKRNWGNAIGKRPEDCAATPENLSVWLDNNRRAFAGEKLNEQVTLQINGEKRFYRNVVAPITTDGGIQGILGLNIDITETKRAEQELQKAHDELECRVEQRTAELTKANEELAVFRRFVESSSQGFGMANLKGEITYVNPAIGRLLAGGRPEDMVGNHISKYYPKEYMDQRETAVLPRILREGHWEGEIVIPLRSGSMSVLQNSFLVRDEQGNPAYLATVLTDITERRRAEQALRQSHDELRAIYDGMRDGLLVADIETKKFVRCNASMRRMLGYSEDELLSRSVMDIHPTEEVPSVMEKFRVLVDGTQETVDGVPVLRKDGSIFYADISHNALVYNGRYCAAGFFRDITERKRAEEVLRRSEDALRQSERRFRNYFKQGLIGMAATSLDAHWLDANERLCEILGYQRQELFQKTWKEITYPEDLTKDIDQFQRLLAGEIESYTLDKRFVRKDGTVVYTTILVRTFQKENGAIDHIVGLMEDITERKRAEEALRQSEARYRAVVEDQTEIITRLTADGTLTFVNEVFCRFFGKTSQELLGAKWQPSALPEELPMIEDQLRTLSPSNPVVVIENRVYSGQGEVHWMQFVNRGFFDADGNLTEIQAVGRDITERKHAQEALERQHRTLRHLLQSNDHERQLIAYDIHDGLAQYLTGAIMQFETYQHLKETKPKDAAKAYEGGMTTLRQGHFEARRLISGVRPPILDESGVVTAIAHLVNEGRLRNGPEIEFHCEVVFDRLISILENAIYRIVQEGLINACRHSKSERVRVELVQHDDDLRIRIRDWGVGFDPNAVEDDHFGLAGIRERTRLLGGNMTVESKPEQGTCITVELPSVLGGERGGS